MLNTNIPYLTPLIFILVVILQLVNKYQYVDKKYSDMSIELRNKYTFLGYLNPFLQASSIGLHSQPNYNTKLIINIILYYGVLLTGLYLTETIMGRFTMLLILLVAIGVEFISPAMYQLTCIPADTIPFGLVGIKGCCGEAFTWFYLGVILVVLYNTKLGKNMSHLVSYLVVMILVGLFIILYSTFYYFMDKEQTASKTICPSITIGLVPYLLGNLFTVGLLNL